MANIVSFDFRHLGRICMIPLTKKGGARMSKTRSGHNGAAIPIAAALSALLCGGYAAAQTAINNSGELQEIVITAEKHTERLADVPVSAAVVSKQMLANTDSTDISELNKLIPSVNLNGTFN